MKEGAVSSFEAWEDSIFSLGLFNTLILAAAVFAGVFILTRISNRFFKKNLKGNMIFIVRLINIAVIIVAIFCVLMTIKPLQEFAVGIAASSGVAGIVIGLAAQEALGNLFSGFSIGMSKPFEVGEYIEIKSADVRGTVEEITLRHTIIKDNENRRIVVPNSVINKEVVRAAKNIYESTLRALDVGISYDSDIEKAMAIVRRIAEAHPKVLDGRTEEEKAEGMERIRIRVEEFAASAVMLKVFVWVSDVDTSHIVLSDMRLEILKQFKENGIEIPYTYQNVIIKKEA